MRSAVFVVQDLSTALERSKESSTRWRRHASSRYQRSAMWTCCGHLPDPLLRSRRGADHRLGTRRIDDRVVIVVRDTGGGSREVGRGTGQGLSIARQIVEKHRGTLTFKTELGVDTTFCIELPIAGAAAVAA